MSDESTTVETNLSEVSSITDTPSTDNTPNPKRELLKGDIPTHATSKHALGTAAGNEKGLKDKTEKPKSKEPIASKPLRPDVEPVVEKPAYTPNFKFKILDQEKEMDEWIRPLVNSPETENKMRDLLTKAYGMDKIKEDRDTLRDQFGQLRGTVEKEYGPIIQNYRNLATLVQEGKNAGDWGKFFQAAQIPAQGVIRWAADVVAKLEKDPNYLDQEKNSFQTHQNIQNLQYQNETLKQQMERIQMDRQQVELDYTLRSPDVQTFAETFDDRVGRPGAFKQEVIRRGALIEMTEGRVASTQEIVGDLRKYYGGVPQAPAEVVIPAGTPEVAQQGSEGKPVLPTIKSKPGSPAKQSIRSTDDLRKILQSRSAG